MQHSSNSRRPANPLRAQGRVGPSSPSTPIPAVRQVLRQSSSPPTPPQAQAPRHRPPPLLLLLFLFLLRFPRVSSGVARWLAGWLVAALFCLLSLRGMPLFGCRIVWALSSEGGLPCVPPTWGVPLPSTPLAPGRTAQARICQACPST